MKRSKPIKFILAITLIISLFSSVTSAASADSAVSTSELDQYLINAGYPQELIDAYEEEQKMELYAAQATYISHKVTYDTLMDNDSSNEDSITPMSLSNFSHITSFSRIPSTTPGTAKIAVNYNWDWNYDPIFTSSDQYGIAWTDDWNLVSGSSKYNYKAFGYYHSASGSTLYAETAGVQQSGQLKAPPGAGIGYEVNLISEFSKNGARYIVNRHKGWSGFQLYREHDKSGRLEVTAFEAKYFHKEWNLTGEVNVAKTPAVTFSTTAGVSESNADTQTLNWYHKDM
ncbi:hypothetical protein [Paenibacillus sp. O199]|uniref:hypothetical protein n=1 Tax=Paenibacillus sp. O199 TaxID=1643925 RepID=UPI0007BF203C|nr:hypothetical protein [Paenibacillus sp. O199]